MNTIWALATVVIKELYRRKDFYVLFVLTAVLTLAAGSANFFQEQGIVRYVKDICLTLIWLSVLIIGIITAARQIPAEKENRTIFPLLAKPVSRLQLVLGKFLGCWLVCGVALLVFFVFLVLVMGAREHQWPLEGYAKGLWLEWMMMGIVVALALLGSVVFSAPAPNATLCFITVIGIRFIGPHLNKIADQQSEPLNSIIYAIYFLIPHFEWFDLRELIVQSSPLPSVTFCLLATLFAAAYMGLLLTLTWAVFRRKNLNT